MTTLWWVVAILVGVTVGCLYRLALPGKQTLSIWLTVIAGCSFALTVTALWAWLGPDIGVLRVGAQVIGAWLGVVSCEHWANASQRRLRPWD